MVAIKNKMTIEASMDGVKGKHYFNAEEWVNQGSTVKISIEFPQKDRNRSNI